MRPGFHWRCLIWCVAALGVVPVASAQPTAGAKVASKAPVYWVFLVTGKGTQGVERVEVEKMQAAHLANFGRLHKDGKLFAAGPMADPQKKLRGILVATAPDAKSLPELFETDPFVKQGYLTLDAIAMQVAVGAFQTDFDAKKMAEYRLVVLEKSAADGPELDAEARKANLAYCQSIHDAERLCFAGWFDDDKLARRGVLIFRKLDAAALLSLVDELPAVKAKAWKASTFPLFMSDGVVK